MGLRRLRALSLNRKKMIRGRSLSGLRLFDAPGSDHPPGADGIEYPEGENFRYSFIIASSRKQVINQHQRQIDAGSHQHPARFKYRAFPRKTASTAKTAYRDIHIRKNAARFRPFPRPAWNMFPPWKRNGNAGSTA